MKTILVIEDDKDLCDCIRPFLESEYIVFVAFSGEEGLNIFSKEIVSLVILDYSLPGIDGLEVLRDIRKNYKIPVIMITAYGNKELVLKSWRYRADYYFDKPFELKELKEKVEELLGSISKPIPFEELGLNPALLSTDILSALEFINSTLSGPKGISKKINLKEISGVTSLTPKYLSCLFKKECDLGISQAITVLKIEKAKKLLNNGKDIKEVAFELGYNHPNNFSSFFKKQTGRSPSDLSNKNA